MSEGPREVEKVGGRKTCFEHVSDWFKYKNKGEWLNEMKGSLSLTASIIATMTFQLGTNPPGGVIQASLPDARKGFTNCYEFEDDASCPGKGLETEIKKLRLELKKTTERYGRVCKEAADAKLKATTLEKFREEEERNVEQARLAEEAAFALAQVERLKAKAALERAEMSQRLAEMETEKRKQAELKARREQEERTNALREVVYNSMPYRRYDIKELEVATNGFDNDLKIGEGGYGPVFKGVIDHTVVAIKALRPDLAHGEAISTRGSCFEYHKTSKHGATSRCVSRVRVPCIGGYESTLKNV